MGKILITRYEGGVLTALFEGGRIRQLDWNAEGGTLRCGDIFRAKISNISDNIQAAFADLGEGKGYFPLRDGYSVKAGDELTLQIEKEAVKTKLPVLTDRISLPGKYLVLLPGGSGLHVSNRLEKDAVLEELRELLQPFAETNGLIIRTNAAGAERHELLREAECLNARAESLAVRAEHSVCPALLWRENEPYLTFLREARCAETEEILTDEPALFEEIRSWMEANLPEDAAKLRRYDDPQISLNALYSLPVALSKAMEKRVWLKSGGYLVIENTEAMTVIDVNTGKNTGRKNFEKTVFQANCEAADEIAVQLRLRSISGIIVVDFINMKEEEHKKALTERLAAAVRDDPVHTAVEGMTRLGLMEMTREKKGVPLAEKLSRKGKA